MAARSMEMVMPFESARWRRDSARRRRGRGRRRGGSRVFLWGSKLLVGWRTCVAVGRKCWAWGCVRHGVRLRPE